jgi:predicted component of type VI protein secretion system
MAELLVEIIEGPEAGRQVPLHHELEVGRAPDLPLALDDEQVSRHHARFIAEGHDAFVQDEGSTNGTYVNDHLIHSRRLLRPGDLVRIGLTVMALRTAAQPSAVRPVPEVTQLRPAVLEMPPEQELAGAPPSAVSQAPAFRVAEGAPAFVPPAVVGDEVAESDYVALARLVDARVKLQTNVAAFALLSAVGLAIAIYFGVR